MLSKPAGCLLDASQRGWAAVTGWYLLCAGATGWFRNMENVWERLWPTHTHIQIHTQTAMCWQEHRCEHKDRPEQLLIDGNSSLLPQPSSSPLPWLLSISFHPLTITHKCSLSLSPFFLFSLNFIFTHLSCHTRGRDAGSLFMLMENAILHLVSSQHHKASHSSNLHISLTILRIYRVS